MLFERELNQLKRLTPKQLREKYLQLFGEDTRTKNKTWLVRRIAWRLQSNAEGDLSERAKQRAVELARDSDLRLTPPSEEQLASLPQPKPSKPIATEPVAPVPTPSDSRLPKPGTVLTREYKGEEILVKVLANGFEWRGSVFASLSAVAKAITGSHCNGFAFFKLNGDKA